MASAFAEIIARRYDPRIQIAPPQIEAIAGAIATRQPRCNLLVFGAGHDSALWAEINSGGQTLFVEDNATWAAEAEAAGLTVARHDYGGITVAASLAMPDAVIASAIVPPFLAATPWNVILIDGPAGWRDVDPGRALPLCWAARLADPATHVFLHDCERRLEGTFARRLLLPRGPWTIIPASGTTRQLLWSIGRSAEFTASGQTPGP